MNVTNVHAERTSRTRGSDVASVSRSTRPAQQHLWAAALLGLFLVIYLWPALIEGHVLSDDSFLYLLAPWRAYAPSDLTHFMNPLLSDVAMYHYPWDEYVRQSVRGGVFPSWNPYELSGTPFYTNSQNGLTTLFNVPLWLLPLNYALGLVAWLKLWVAALGAYMLARELRLGFWPGILAGVCFALCSFNVGWLEHQTLPASTAWLPWGVLAVERLLRRRGAGDVLLLALASALTIDGGHPGAEVQVLGAVALYAVVRAGTMADVSGAERLRGLGLSAVGFLLGALLMAFVIVPVLTSASGTLGQATRSGGGYVLPGSALRSLFFPGWWGRPSEGNYAGPINYVERTLYAGVVGLLLAGLSLTVGNGWRRKLPFLVIGIVGPGIAVEALPLTRAIVVRLPLFDSVQAARMIFWGPFAIAMLAAFGLQAVLDRPREMRSRAIGLGVVSAAIAGIALVALAPSLHQIRTAINHFRTGIEYHEPVVLALTAIGWWLIFAVVVTAAVWALRVRRVSPRIVAIVLVLAAALDMYHFAAGFQPMGPLPRAIPPKTPAIAFLQREAGQSRVVGLNEALVADANLTYRIREPTGQDPPQPTLRYFHLWQLANPEQNEVFGLTLPTLTTSGLRVMSVLGVRYIVADSAAARLRGLPVVYRGDDLVVYLNRRAVAPAFVPAVVHAVASEKAVLTAIARPGFDPRREALLEGGAFREAGSGTVSIESEAGATVRMNADMGRSGLVVLNDSWAKGWSARIDGRPTPVLRVNSVMRGVDVPAGTHTITWSYEVPGLRDGVVASIIAVLACAAVTGWLVLLRVRRRSARSTVSVD